MDFHLPDGRTISPYYPPLLSPIFGWLLCVSSLIGGCLMPSNNIFIIFGFCSNHHLHYDEITSPILSNPHAPSLQRHSHCGRQFIVDCCLLSLNGSHLVKANAPSISSRCAFITSKPVVAPPSPAAAASSPGCCCSQYHRTSLFGDCVVPKEVLVVRL